MKPEIYFFITKTAADETRQVRNALKKLKDLYDNDKLESDSLLLTPVKKTVKFSNFREAITEKASDHLYKNGSLKINDIRKLILKTERTFSIPPYIEAILGVFVSNKMFLKIDECKWLKYIIIIPSEISDYDFWIKQWNPRIFK